MTAVDKMKKMNVLLIDDDEIIRKSMKFYFRNKTMSFVAVENAELGFEQVRNGAWDIIISDYKLPGMNGIDFFDKVIQHGDKAIKILITAYEMDVGKIKTKIHDFIQKPFTAGEITASLTRLI